MEACSHTVGDSGGGGRHKLGGYRDAELAPAVGARQVDERTAVATGDCAGLVQTEADAFGFAGERIAALLEGRERAIDVVLGQAGTSIEDRESDSCDRAPGTIENTRRD